jgi:lysozyme family protein
MKQNRVSQKEKERILQMYGSKYLNEETTGNKTIQDIQKLVGVKDDNILGPQTLAAIQAKLGQPEKSTTPNVDGLTYKDLVDAGWTDEQIGKSNKYKSLLPKESEQKTVQGSEPKTGEVLKVKRDTAQSDTSKETKKDTGNVDSANP